MSFNDDSTEPEHAAIKAKRNTSSLSDKCLSRDEVLVQGSTLLKKLFSRTSSKRTRSRSSDEVLIRFARIWRSVASMYSRTLKDSEFEALIKRIELLEAQVKK